MAEQSSVTPEHGIASLALQNPIVPPLTHTWGQNAAGERVPIEGAMPRPIRPKILNNVLQFIGETPMIRINRIGKEEGLQCELLAKCEYFNAGGSVKDRIGKRMVDDAERTGRIHEGDVLIEPTSGNTGIGLALSAAVKGYRCIITLPEKMSKEKVDVLKALGAEIIRTPTEAAWDAPESHIGVALRLNKEIPHSHILDQYNNASNPLVHYDCTAEEIWEQCDGHIDMIVLTAGTGGTVSGIGRRLKELNPNIVVVAVDPKGSILAVPESLNDEKRLQSYKVEGIGYDFIPNVLDRSIVDFWLKTDDAESLIMSRRLIRQEGLLCGGSSGSALVGAVQAARSLGPDKRCVVLLADSVRNYMTKFLSDEWMIDNGFADGNIVKLPSYSSWWANNVVSDLHLSHPTTLSSSSTCQEAITILSSQGFDMIPVIDPSGSIIGIVTEGSLTALIAHERIQASDSVDKAMYKTFRRVNPGTLLSDLATVFDREHFAVVLANGSSNEVCGVVTRIDLLNFISKGQTAAASTK